MMWNKHQSRQLMDDEGVVQVIGELTDFVYVGSAETEEDKEETQPERPDSQKDIGDDTEEDSPEANDSPETWFPIEKHTWGIQYTRIPRTGHSPYTKSWRYYAAKRVE